MGTRLSGRIIYSQFFKDYLHLSADCLFQFPTSFASWRLRAQLVRPSHPRKSQKCELAKHGLARGKPWKLSRSLGSARPVSQQNPEQLSVALFGARLVRGCCASQHRRFHLEEWRGSERELGMNTAYRISSSRASFSRRALALSSHGMDYNNAVSLSPLLLRYPDVDSFRRSFHPDWTDIIVDIGVIL
jgi:hypothetical protein